MATPETSSAPRHLLLATDLSARCDRAHDRALMLARRWGAKLTVVHALDVLDAPNDQPARPTAPGAEERARKLLHEEFADAESVEFVIREGKPTAVVMEVADELGSDMILTGIAGNSPFGQSMLGSTVTALARRSTVPVLVVKKRPRTDYQRVLAASDLSQASAGALAAGHALFGAASSFELFHVFEPPIRRSAFDEALGAARAQVQAFLAQTGMPDLGTVVRSGDPAVALADHVAEADTDLAVVGSHGARGLMTVLLGSTAVAILDETPCDILVVPVAHRRRS